MPTSPYLVRVFSLWSDADNPTLFPLKLTVAFVTQAENREEACEQAFHITNAPEEVLTEFQQQVLKANAFRGPSCSVGDIVEVTAHNTPTVPHYYVCSSQGWTEIDSPNLERVYTRDEYVNLRLNGRMPLAA